MLLGCKRAATCGKRLRQQQHIWRCSKTKSNATPTKHQAQWGLVCSVQIAFHTSIEEGLRARQYIYQTITLYHNGTTVPRLYHNCTTTVPHFYIKAQCTSLMGTRAPSAVVGTAWGAVQPILVAIVCRPPYFGHIAVDCPSSSMFWLQNNLLRPIIPLVVFMAIVSQCNG